MKEHVLNIFRYLLQKIYLHIINRRLISFDKKLKPGISVLVCCKNEEYSISYCLKSLTGFASQVICVDNGSDDATYDRMVAFREAYKDKIDIFVIRAQNLNLKDARNKGLKFVNRKWLLNIGGDFIFHTNGINDFNKVVEKILKRKTYNAYRMGMVSLYGDLYHTYKDVPVYRVGEHYLVRYGMSIEFREEDKFDFLYFPIFYRKYTVNKPVFFHMDGLKSDDRLIFRNCYFEWRKLVNSETDIQLREKLNDFGYFATLWKRELFGISEGPGLRYRFNRQLAVLHYQPYNEEKYYYYPAIVREIIEHDGDRFRVKSKNGKPYSRQDKRDTELIGYQPSQEDIDWDIHAYNLKYHRKDYLNKIKEEMLKK